MEKLSNAEKAKRYDEALKKARNIVNSINVGLIGKDSFEAVFPELKENEDEKIRKELLNAFQESEDSLYMVLTPHKRESFIAWLEKQGDANKEYWRGYREGKQEILDKYSEIEKQGETFTKKDVDDAYLKGVLDTKHKLENQSEQKPLFKKGDTVFWDGEEFNILDITKDSYNVGGYIIPIYRQNELLLKQKPAEKTEPKFKKE